MEKQSLIQNICSLTGMSKRSLGAFVETSHSTLSRHDTGTRDIPAKSFQLLVKMYQDLQTVAGCAGPAASEKDIAEVNSQAAWCLAQCHPLRKKLAAMQGRYQQSNAMLGLLGALATGNNGDLTPGKQLWMDNQYFIAKKKCSVNGWAAQLKITTAIALLQYEADVLTNAASSFAKQ